MSGMPTEVIPGPAKQSDMMVLARGLAGAIVGGILGYALFWICFRAGLVGYMIPGVVLGLCAGWAARSKSQMLGVICAFLAIGLTLFTAWHIAFNHFAFPEFLSRLHRLDAVRQIMMVLGVVGAYWFGQGR
jgi:hypothetical protein